MTVPTTRQRRVYDFIRDFQRQHTWPPTVREMMTGLGIGSPNGVACHLRALAAKGWISVDFGRPRSIRLLREPAAACPHCGGSLS